MLINTVHFLYNIKGLKRTTYTVKKALMVGFVSESKISIKFEIFTRQKI